MTRYEIGANLERDAVDFFRYHGFIAIRSAGSKTDWDIVATPPVTSKVPDTLHIQAGPKSVQELNRLNDNAAYNYGMFAHLKRGKKRGEVLITLLPSIFNSYMEPSDFLKGIYNFNSKLLLPWHAAIKKIRQQRKKEKEHAKIHA